MPRSLPTSCRGRAVLHSYLRPDFDVNRTMRLLSVYRMVIQVYMLTLLHVLTRLVLYCYTRCFVRGELDAASFALYRILIRLQLWSLVHAWFADERVILGGRCHAARVPPFRGPIPEVTDTVDEIEAGPGLGGLHEALTVGSTPG